MDDEQAPRAVGGLRGFVRGLVDDRGRATSFVQPSETVALDVRRVPVLMVVPAVRTVAALLVLLAGPVRPAVLVLAVTTAVWARTRLHTGVRQTLIAGAGGAVGLLLLDAVVGPLLCLLALAGWLAEDVADWWTDRLVVTDRRVYRRYGVVTTHSPSIALTAIAYLDASVPPLGRVFSYGTLRLDSAAQRDAPLSRFDVLPDVEALSHEILRLRSAALPKFPMPPT